MRRIYLASVLLIALGTSPMSGQTPGLDAAVRQFASVPLRAQESKDPAPVNAKIDASLRELVAGGSDSAKGLAGGVPPAGVAVEIKVVNAGVLEGVRRAVERQGGVITAGFENTLFATVQVGAIAPLGDLRDLYSIGRQPVFRLMQEDGALLPKGEDVVRAVGAARLHRAGITGRGVRIGILDFGFLRYDEFAASGRLPRPVAAMAFNESGRMAGDGAGHTHGTACAEIVHDIAPGAELVLAATDGRMDRLIRAAEWLASQGVHIISFSGGSSLGPHDGRALLDRFVDFLAKQHHTLWITASGNEALSHWSGDASVHDKSGWIEFSQETREKLFLETGRDGVSVNVMWDDWGDDPLHPAATQAIDAYLFRVDPRSRVVEQVASRIFSPGRLAPVAVFAGPFEAGGVYVLELKARRVDRRLRVHVFAEGARVAPGVPQRSIIIPATSNSAISVGAVSIQNQTIEEYSSRGPTDDGRPKPEISAYDVIQSIVYQQGFAGTSAACPNTTGFAALVAQARPGLSGLQLREEVLRYVHRPRHLSGDGGYGRGILDASLFPVDGRIAPLGAADVSVPFPGALGGRISAESIDYLLRNAANLRAFDVSIVLGRAGRLPVYSYGEGIQLAFRCAEHCYFAVLNRDAAGKYTLVHAGEDPLNPGRDYVFPGNAKEYITVTAPSGREQFILIAASEPLRIEEMAGTRFDLLARSVALSVAEYEVRP